MRKNNFFFKILIFQYINLMNTEILLIIIFYTFIHVI